MSQPGTIYSLPDAPGLPLVAWLEVEAGAEGGTSGKIAIIHGPALSMDADGNPTPNPDTYPAGRYPDGSLFYPTAYPAAVDSGDGMVFRMQNGAWRWITGSYWASNNNGSYVRSADGQQVSSYKSDLLVTPNTAGAIYRTTSVTRWNYPAPYVRQPRVTPSVEYGNNVEPISARVSTPELSYTNFHLYGTQATSDGYVVLVARGSWR